MASDYLVRRGQDGWEAVFYVVRRREDGWGQFFYVVTRLQVVREPTFYLVFCAVFSIAASRKLCHFLNVHSGQIQQKPTRPMADNTIQEAILHGDLIVSVNTTLAPYNTRKLPPWLEGPIIATIGGARAAHSALQLAAGDVAGASGRVKTADERLAAIVRTVNAHFFGIPLADPGVAPDADTTDLDERMDALVSMGFEQGELGDLTSRTNVLRIVDAIIANNAAMRPLLRVPTATISRLTNWRGVLVANVNIANGGSREPLTTAKDDALDALEKLIARVRLYIAAASPLGEYDSALALYDFQVKRAWGEAQPQPKPGAIGAMTFDGATRIGSVAALPENASMVVGWRQILGGEPELAGQSDTGSVNFAEVGPFIPNGDYTLWMTGKNGAGYGPESNKVSWKAPL